jgi:23S rRNA (cytosine1962-C5)-methyltransferase
MDVVVLKPGREKSLLRRHPWIFSGAIAEVHGTPHHGETVEVHSSAGDFLAYGAYSPDSQIRVRVWSWKEGETIDEAFFRHRLKIALAARQLPPSVPPFSRASNSRRSGESTEREWGEERGLALRLVHAESDGLPGLILDRYDDTLVMQCLAAGSEYWRSALADLAMELSGARRIYERSDVDVRQLEGLPSRVGIVRGDEPPEQIRIQENGLSFHVDVRQGHKTGFYLDQRLNRKRVRELAAGRDVLDCFSYSGGFALNALAGEASSVLAVDSSADALGMARENLALNDLPSGRFDLLEGDIFQVLRSFRDSRRTFDMIVLDPPKFAPTTAQAERATRGYKDINLLAIKLLKPDGLLVSFSCSGGISADLFQKIVAGAALDAGVDAQILEHLHQAPDHPVALNFPEGSYLKGLVVRVV